MRHWKFPGFNTNKKQTRQQKHGVHSHCTTPYPAHGFGWIITCCLLLGVGNAWGDCDSVSVNTGGGVSNVTCIDPPDPDSMANFDIATGAVGAVTDTELCDASFTSCAAPGNLPGGGATGTYYFQRAAAAGDIWEGDWVMGVGFVAGRVSTLPPTPVPLFSPFMLLLAAFGLGGIGWWRFKQQRT